MGTVTYRLAVLVGPANVNRYDIAVDKPVAIVPPLVIMVMTEEPGAAREPAVELLKKRLVRIPAVEGAVAFPTEVVRDVERCLVRDHVVNIPAAAVEVEIGRASCRERVFPLV